MGTQTSRRRRLDLRVFKILWPIGAAVLLTVVLLFILRAASSLATWTEVYGPTGGFTVEECSTEPNRLGARI
ncbi:MAG: hypothetical protein OEV40_20705, partial [Acidimicrobiia bacterium]|nr:hypothetical protein [Acidimicrobiia bacterium]